MSRLPASSVSPAVVQGSRQGSGGQNRGGKEECSGIRPVWIGHIPLLEKACSPVSGSSDAHRWETCREPSCHLDVLYDCQLPPDFMQSGRIAGRCCCRAGSGTVLLHAVFRAPNLKARMASARQEFRAVWRGYQTELPHDYTL